MSLVFLVGVDCSSCGSRALEYAVGRARVKDARLVGRQGSSRLRAHLFGSVASTLVQIADRPVTVVP